MAEAAGFIEAVDGGGGKESENSEMCCERRCGYTGSGGSGGHCSGGWRVVWILKVQFVQVL